MDAIKKSVLVMKHNISVADVNPILVLVRQGPLDTCRMNDLIDSIAAKLSVTHATPRLQQHRS